MDRDDILNLDTENADLLKEFQKLYTEKKVEDFIEISGLADSHDVNELVENNLLYFEDCSTKIVTEITKNKKNLEDSYNLSIAKISNLKRDLLALKSKPSSFSNKLIYKEDFNSFEYINLSLSDFEIDVINQEARNKVEDITSSDILTIEIGNQSTEDSLIGCNFSSDRVNIEGENLVIVPTENNSYSLVNLADNSQTTGFELEKYFIRKVQPIKQKGYYLASDVGKNTDIEKLLSTEKKTVTVNYGSQNIKEVPKFNYSENAPESKLNLELTFTITPSFLTEITLNFFKRKFEVLGIVKSVEVFNGSSWSSLNTIEKNNSGNYRVTLDNTDEISKVKVIFENSFYTFDRIINPFFTKKILKKSTRKHGLWRTVDKWESYEREEDVFSTKGLSAEDGSIPTSISSVDSGNQFYSGEGVNPIATASALNKLSVLGKGAYKDFKKFTSKPKKIDPNASEEEKRKIQEENKKLESNSNLSNKLKDFLGEKKFNQSGLNQVTKALDFAGAAASYVQAGITIYNVVKIQFSYNRENTLLDSFYGYDLFKGWKSSIFIKSINFYQKDYSTSSVLVSKKLDVTNNYNAFGLFVEVSEDLGYKYFLSSDGSTWTEVSNLKNNSESKYSIFGASTIFYKVETTQKNRNNPLKSISVVGFQ